MTKFRNGIAWVFEKLAIGSFWLAELARPAPDLSGGPRPKV